MARLNIVHLKGVLLTAPITITRKTDGKKFLRSNLLVSRGVREVENDLNGRFMTDKPYIMTTDERVIAQMENLQAYDIVSVKGVLTTKKVPKISICPECGIQNKVDGILTFLTPIFAEKTGEVKDDDDAIRYLNSIRQISNEVNIFGRLTRDPKKISPKTGLVVTQYQIALNRNYIITDDPPELRADYPWVRSYGKDASEDKKRLRKDSIVFIDGYIQTRNVNRHSNCVGCNAKYDWADKSMEIVPYDTEYIRNYNTDEEIEKAEKERLEQIKRDIFNRDKEKAYYDFVTNEDIEAGIDAMEDDDDEDW